MALQSGVRSELAWALDVLALASCSGAIPLELRHHPDLLPLLLQVRDRIAAVTLTLVCNLSHITSAVCLPPVPGSSA